MDFSISGQMFALGLILTFAIVRGLPMLVKYLMESKSNDLPEKYKGTEMAASPTVKKYPEANVFHFSGSYLRLGLVFLLRHR